MPPTAVTEIGIDNIVACLTPVIPLLNEFNDAFGTPFISAIANTTLSLITLVQNVKRNKAECIQLMEHVHELLYTIIHLHVKSGTASSLPPATLSAFGELIKTLHKIHAFMEAQQEGNKIKHFFRQSEMKTLLNECHTGLQQAVDIFKLEGSGNLHRNIIEMQKETERIHKELLESISTSSDATISDKSSSIHQWNNDLHNSSNSIAMLPAKPKIFHGRESELKDVVTTLKQEPSRIAILGAGGMGKTSLAKAALHHSDIVSKYQQRFFVASDSATTSIELAALIGLHLGLKPGRDLTKCLASGTYKRPGKVRWTRPFLQPLKSLSDDAAYQTFVAIAEDFHDNEDITKLLSLTDNLPLAVDLIAHLVDHEGCENVLARWGTEKTSLLSSGHDRRSNLDISITISLSSPRLNSGAKDLLSLLSILPDGLSGAELLQISLPIKDVLECRSMLLRTSLAYEDDRKRLKSLVPIREHVQQFYPAPPLLIHQVEKHFHLLLDAYKKHRGLVQVGGKSNQITSNMGNLHQILLRGLHQDNPTLTDTINCVIILSSFNRVAGYGHHVLLDHIPAVISSAPDDRLQASFIIELFNSRVLHLIINPEQLLTQAICHFGNLDDLSLEYLVTAAFYHAVGEYSIYKQGNISKATQFLDKALILAKSCGNKKQQAIVLGGLALMLWNTGDYPAAKVHARRAQRLSQLSGDLYIESYALLIEALCVQDLGDYKNSVWLCHRGRRLLDLCGLSQCSMKYSFMNDEAEAHFLKSEYAEARCIQTEIVLKAETPYVCAWGLLNLAHVDILIGASVQDVHRSLDKAKEIFAATASHGLTFCEITLAELNLRERQAHTAKLLFQRCFASTAQKHTQGALACLEKLADTSQWPACDFEWASRWTVVYLVYAKRIQNKRALHKALQFLGDVFLTQGDLNTSDSLFNVALETFTYMDIHHSRAECILRLGDIARHRGEFAQAADRWKEARPLFERSSQAKDMAQIDTKLVLLEQEVSDRHQKPLTFFNELEPPTTSVEELPITSDMNLLNLQAQSLFPRNQEFMTS
ncbi:hypothetical protein C8R44DRAFT_904766 [Mycena epipterygia]|nr:hypothetical protein C8R44DRAFT_904766 [Mycena epipterygia]